MSHAESAHQPSDQFRVHPTSATSRRMPYAIRVAAPGDAAALTHLERATFPSMTSGTPFRQELKRESTYYLIATRPTRSADNVRQTDTSETHATQGNRILRLLRRLISAAPGAGHDHDRPPEEICGVVGLWFMVDECHVVIIATSHGERRRGLGERLMIGAIDEAFRRGSRVVTLEVRASNHAARALYRKYLFKDAGIRKRYYSDNNEDAVIMTTPHIQDPEFLGHYKALVGAHTSRWGEAPAAP